MTVSSARTSQLRDSEIRRMSALCQTVGGVNLAQGFPDFESPVEIRDAARAAIAADVSQYAPTQGTARLRGAIADHYRRRDARWTMDPDANVCVTCGGTEAIFAAMAATLKPGDEVIVPEPFYESYGPVAVLLGAVPRYVPLRNDWTLDLDALWAAGGPRTAMIVLNFPHNPSGSLLDAAEAKAIGDIAGRWDAVVLSDELYDHLVFDGPMVHPALERGAGQRTVTVGGISKTYSLTGWRIGWTVAPPALTTVIKRIHDVVTCGAAAPLQDAAVTALSLGASYDDRLKADYVARRNLLCNGLEQAGFTFVRPRGGYFVLANYSALDSRSDDKEFAHRLLAEAGVAGVPGSYFFSRSGSTQLLRFAFCKKLDTLQEAVRRLLSWNSREKRQ